MTTPNPRVRVRAYDRIRYGGHESVIKHTRRYPNSRPRKTE